MTDRFSLIGETIADRYLIQELLGEGGMGRVYLAEHVRMGRKSAVKVMNPALAVAADAITRFNREAANASRINHPNVAQIYDFGETADGMLYLAMEYIEGETLTEIIERGGPLSIQRAANITRQVADALNAAHHLGIVHRDLKPENIMVARHLDGSDWVKVVDFGIAKTTQQTGGGSQTVTTAGVSLGTPEYMSPEQLAGERLDQRSDIYSLGLVCFNMLTGDLPYPRLTSKETLVKRLTSKPRTLSEVRPNGRWPESLQHALDHALAPEAADRYDSVAEFGRDITRAAEMFADDPDRTVRIDAPARTRAVIAPTVGERSSPPTRRLAASGGRRVASIAAGVALVGFGGYLLAAHLRPSKVHAAEPAAPQRVVAVPRVTTQGEPLASAVPSSPPAAAPKPTPTPTPTPAAPAPEVAAVSKKPIAGPHAWLRANGDSGAARTVGADATVQQRLQLMHDEIAGHISRANAVVAQAQFQKARGDFMAAGQELNFLRELFPGLPQIRELQRSLVQSVGRAYQDCRATLPDTPVSATPGNHFRCENLLPRGANANRNLRRFGQSPRQPNW